jgi:glucoamylase
MTLPLADWIERQAEISAAKMARAISATDLVFQRPGFGQTVRPAPGSILASPETELGGGPDYFFHWIRDGAAVMEAMRLLAGGRDGSAWIARFEDCVRFSLALGRICGEGFLRNGDFRARVAPDFLKFVRPDAEIAALSGERVLGDVRYGADGQLDFIKWSRPQHDGAALEALVAMRFSGDGRSSGAAARAELEELIRRDLDYSARHIADPCYDIWEEELGEHYYPRLVQLAALEAGAARSRARGDHARAGACREAAARLAPALDAFWSAEDGFYRSRLAPLGVANPKALDMSVILALLHAGRASGAHSIVDARMVTTLNRIKAHFAAVYPLNRERGIPFALGRYPGDRYFDGSAWYLCSFAAAEFEYRRAAALGDPAPVAHGDAILAAVRAYVPESGALSEQFHPATGAQLSARNLTWSYAAFITAAHARNAAIHAGR